MSKQSEAKKEQGYRETPDTCSNCAHYSSKMVEKSYQGFIKVETWTEEKEKKCQLGSFAVKKTATCDKHVLSAQVAK